MRDYLYLWHDPQLHFIVTSGLCLSDFVRYLPHSGGLLLLAHEYADATQDEGSRFDYVSRSEIERLNGEDVYAWGDICWVDYSPELFPALTKKEVAELLYFRHVGEPFQDIIFPSLKNRFLATGHDDGWFLKLYYNSWNDMADLLGQLELIRGLTRRSEILDGGAGAFWIDRNGILEEEATFDIDSILNRRSRKGGGA